MSFFAKKTTLHDALVMFDDFHGKKFKLDYRNEAYAIKAMLLCIAQSGKNMQDGSRLKKGLQKLATKHKGRSNFLSAIRQSPTFKRTSMKKSRGQLSPMSSPQFPGTPGSPEDAQVVDGSRLKVPTSWNLPADTLPMSSSSRAPVDEGSVAQVAVPVSTPAPRRDFRVLMGLAPKTADADASSLLKSTALKDNAMDLPKPAGENTASHVSPRTAEHSESSYTDVPLYLDAYDHYSGRCKRVHRSGEVEFAECDSTVGVFLQCRFKNDDVYQTDIPSLAIVRAESSAIASKGKKLRKKRKLNAKAKATAKPKAKGKAKLQVAVKSKVKAKAKAKRLLSASAQARPAPKAKGKAKGKAKALAPALDRTNAFYGKLQIGKYTGQSYIQYFVSAADGKRVKRLIIAVNVAQCAQHADIIDDLAVWINQHDRELSRAELVEKRAILIADKNIFSQAQQ